MLMVYALIVELKMTRLLAKKWSKEDKSKMLKVVGELIAVMEKHKDLEIPEKIFILSCMHDSFWQSVGMIKAFGLDKIGKGRKDLSALKRTVQIVEGMEQSNVNLVIFRNDPEVWMQYWMGLYLQKNTYVLFPKEEKHEIDMALLQHPLVKKIMEFETEEEMKAMIKKMSDDLYGNK